VLSEFEGCHSNQSAKARLPAINVNISRYLNALKLFSIQGFFEDICPYLGINQDGFYQNPESLQ